jgi:hypothetical protein
MQVISTVGHFLFQMTLFFGGTPGKPINGLSADVMEDLFVILPLFSIEVSVVVSRANVDLEARRKMRGLSPLFLE